MTSPLCTDFLKLVSTDMQVIQFGALDCGPFKELIIGDVEPLKVREGIILLEHSH